MGGAWCVAVTRDGKRAATGGADNVVRLWDVQTGKQTRQLAGHTAQVHGVAWSHDGRRLLSASYDKSARLWDVEDDLYHHYRPHDLDNLSGPATRASIQNWFATSLRSSR